MEVLYRQIGGASADVLDIPARIRDDWGRDEPWWDIRGDDGEEKNPVRAEHDGG